MRPSTVIIAGAGQLGSRYLQGLANVSTPMDVLVFDVSPDALKRAEARWREVAPGNPGKKVTFSNTLEGVTKAVDIVVVATTADVRPRVVDAISRATKVQYWVLEKVLAQSEDEVSFIESLLRRASGAWVNTPRRLMPWHKKIRAELCGARTIKLSVTGGSWGLASNAIHFLDLLQWWTRAPLEAVKAGRLGPNWFEGKRPGCWELTGTLEAVFVGGSVALLSVTRDHEPIRLQASVGRDSWHISETAGTAVRNDGVTIDGRLSLQSELTCELIETLLATGCCELPTLAESAALHRPLLRELLAHWNTHMYPQANAVPIT